MTAPVDSVNPPEPHAGTSPAAGVRREQHALVRGRLAGITVVVLVLGGAAWVHALGARPPSWYPPCWVHAATGLHCPGCGTARALHALAQGDITRAVDQNVVTVAMLPVLLVWAVWALRQTWRTGRARAALPGGWALGLLIVLLTFTLLRNLPWWPFALLAPE